MATAPDSAILERAAALGRILYTNDDDYFILNNEWARNGRVHAGIIYTHQKRLSVRQQIDALQLICEAMYAEESVGRIIHIPL
jgi:hypothetical protein